MKHKISSSKLIMEPELDLWQQVHDFKPQDKQKHEKYGHLIALISFKDGDFSDEGRQVEKLETGREILTRLHEEYFGKKHGASLKALTSATKKVIDEFADESIRLDIAAAVFFKDIVYLSLTGNTSAYLFRENKLVKLIEGVNEKAVSISGRVISGDTFLLGTSEFFDLFSSGELKATLAGSVVAGANEKLAPKLRTLDSGSPAGCALVSVEEDKQTPFVVNDFSSDGEDTEGDVKEHKPKFQSLRSRVLGGRLGRGIKVRKQKLDTSSNKQSKKTTISVGIILILILVTSIFFGARSKNLKEKDSELVNTLSQAEHNLEEAHELYGIDPERARELFSESRSIVEELRDQGIEDERLDEIVKKMDSSEERILGIYEAGSEVFWDLTLLSEGFEGKEVVKSNKKAYILNKSGDKIASLEIETKRSEVEVGPSVLEGAERLTVYSDRMFVLQDKKLMETDDDESTEIDSVSTNDFLIATFAGNIYLLNSNSSQIYRYFGDGREFSNPSPWLSEGVEPDLSSIIAWSIDGTIWLLSGSGKVFRYSAGNQLDFNVKGVFPQLSTPTDIFTEEESNYLYLLDPEQKRVVVLDKEGDYVAQYRSNEMEGAQRIIVSEEEGLLLYLTGPKLYSVELGHLDEGEIGGE